MTKSVLTLTYLVASLLGNSAHAAPAQRVVSLDYCADQFILELLPRESVLALSPDAASDFSYMREAATGLATVRPVAEDVLTIQPEVIVRSYGGGPHAAKFFERAGISVVQIPFADDLNAIRVSVRTLAKQLGVVARGEQVVAEMDRRIAQLPKSVTGKSALYMTPTGATSGSGTLIHEMLRAAGFSNFQNSPGWRSLPLERLAYEQPDVVAAAFFDAEAIHPSQWSSMRHPIAKQQISDRPTAYINGASTSCGGWFLLDAIEALTELQNRSDNE